ncbi:MAG: threonine/serine exporter family protein [Muribaculaceae bacterium]|nr:threonine/serine exporter family protein [Muribaculaceae bacterium]
MIEKIIEDALFAAIAAVGFASISKPPKRAYIYCAAIAAAGHSLRYILINYFSVGIVISSLIASFTIGLLAVFMSPRAKMPAETCLFPSLLPMIPGIYAYKAFAGLAMCMIRHDKAAFDTYFYLFAENAIITTSVILMLVIGATIPIFAFNKISFRATR